MKRLMYILLAVETVIVVCALTRVLASNLAVVLLAGNSILLIWSLTRLRRKPSCCR